MADSVEHVLTAIAYLKNANRHLRVNLETNEQILAEAELRLKQGSSVTSTLRLLPSLSDRQAAELAVTELYNARHNMRRAVVAAALKEGMSVGELANRIELTPEQVQTIAHDIAWHVD
jgi:ribosome-binding protein aMBF1 (putative translation factor)